jgi:hypothetical protein
MSDLFSASSAILSDCGRYRYRLSREWGAGPHALFIMLNPSTADACADDPTIRRCMGFARSWGCGGIEVVNLFAFRATIPEDMIAADDPVGPDNMSHVQKAVEQVTTGILSEWLRGPVVCAWGAQGRHMGQDETVLGWIEAAGVVPMALKTTKNGSPSHPLYLPGTLVPAPLEKLRGAA